MFDVKILFLFFDDPCRQVRSVAIDRPGAAADLTKSSQGAAGLGGRQ
jgi:hypothetical protein